MPARLICPHCHSPIDPQSMDMACCGDAIYRICPECDEPVAQVPPADGNEAGRMNAPHPATEDATP